MTTIRVALVACMMRHIPRLVAETIAEGLPASSQSSVGSLDLLRIAELMQWLEGRLKLFAQSTPVSAETIRELRRTITGGAVPTPTREAIVIADESGVLASQRASRALVKPFFGPTDCVRLVTVVSELARNIYMYAGTGSIELSVAEDSRGGVVFTVVASDRGPGIADIDTILSGSFVSKTGLGRGLRGSKAILDDLHVMTTVGAGTTVRGMKRTRGKS